MNTTKSAFAIADDWYLRIDDISAFGGHGFEETAVLLRGRETPLVLNIAIWDFREILEQAIAVRDARE